MGNQEGGVDGCGPGRARESVLEVAGLAASAYSLLVSFVPLPCGDPLETALCLLNLPRGIQKIGGKPGLSHLRHCTDRRRTEVAAVLRTVRLHAL